ncbi:hypothetical protein WME97_00875 [Sorangium sp. So ce367]|uniref:hypothetical protein n=1 Tax=Sorangium sp. So ce367 TaxID=3133305 RepID=UPI003F602EF6
MECAEPHEVADLAEGVELAQPFLGQAHGVHEREVSVLSEHGHRAARLEIDPGVVSPVRTHDVKDLWECVLYLAMRPCGAVFEHLEGSGE